VVEQKVCEENQVVIERPKSETENRAHMAIHAMIAGLVFCLALGGFFHFAPYDTPATMAAVRPAAAVAQSAPPTNCLPSGNGGPCLSFDKIQEMMDPQPDAPEPIPANPAAPNEETI
jgi:hypothetical protein